MKLDLREDKYAKTKGIKDVKKASDEVLQDTIDTGSPAAKPAEKELKSRKKKAAASGENSEKTPEEKPAEKEAEKPAEKPEETPDEEPKDEPKEPESDSTDSEDDESDDATDKEVEKAQKVTTSAYEKNINKLKIKHEKMSGDGGESQVKRAILNFLDQTPAKMIGVDFGGYPEGTKSSITKIHDFFQARAKKIMGEKSLDMAKKIESLEDMAAKLSDKENYTEIIAVMKKNGINSPKDFANLSEEERDKLMAEIEDAINMKEIADMDKDDTKPNDDKEETPKDDAEEKEDDEEKPKDDSKGATAANESIYGIRGAIRAVQESTGTRKDYASMRTILNRMYGEQ